MKPEEMIEKKKEFEEVMNIFRRHGTADAEIWVWISSSLQEMYNKGIEDCIEVCDKQITAFQEEFDREENSTTIDIELNLKMDSLEFIKQQLSKLKEG
jgi:hypothetical protein